MTKKITHLMASIAFIFAFSLQANAQKTDTLKMSLAECVDYGLKNSILIKNSTLDEEIASSKIGDIRSIGLPQITGQIGVQHNLMLRETFLQASATNPFLGQLVAADPSLEGKVTKISNFFQLPNSLDASLNVTQIIFSSSYIIGLQAAKTYKELAQKSTEESKIQTTNNITKAYYLALINLERINLFNTNIQRLDSMLNETKKLQTNGFVEQIDVSRLEVTLNNLITEREKFVNIMLLSNSLLKYQMGMPLESNLVLTDKISTLQIAPSDAPNKIDYNQRVEYKQLMVSKRLQTLDLKNNRSSYLPTLVASANLGMFTSNSDFGFFSTQNFFKGYDGGWDTNGIWSRYGSINLGLQIPIFDGLSKTYKIQQSKLNIKKTENSQKMLENSIDLQVVQTSLTLNSSLKAMEVQKRNMELAKQINTVVYKKYKQGMSSNFELISSESSLKEAQINYYNALYDALVAKIECDQAQGNTNLK